MTSAETRSGHTLRPTAIAHISSIQTHPHLVNSPVPPKELDHYITTSPFRLRDLPEELQRHCISFCIPSEWHIRASGPMRIACGEGENPYIYGLRHVPPIPARLYLVDKHTSLQAQAVSLKCFTGELYLASVVDQAGFKTYSQYGLGQEMTSSKLDSFRNLITTVHTGSYQCVQDFGTFDSNLIFVLPKLRTVIAHSARSLHEESLYGWGDANHLIGMLSDNALINFMQRQDQAQDMEKSTAATQVLWQAGIRTLLEMKIVMGSGEMIVSFYCIFLLRKDTDPVILGKFSVKEWQSSSKLRMNVYERAI